MSDIFRHLLLIDTIGRVGTIANSADSAYYTVMRHKNINVEKKIERIS